MDEREREEMREVPPQDATAESGGAEPEVKPDGQIAELQSKADEFQDKYLRSVAEFANFRKRQDRERQQQTARITMDVLARLLPVLDDLKRALEHAPAESANKEWVTGVAMIERKLQGLLEDYGVQKIEAVGKPFDPNYHSALLQADSDEFPEGIVLEELQSGYLLGNQVLRPTTVKVSNGPGPHKDSGSEF
ncbi:MAG: nucleotide exchange factor GrpE [Anaerolineae bacterium]